MKRLNNFVRAYLFKRLLLPFIILICLNIFLVLMSGETVTRIYLMLVSAVIVITISLWIILYPRVFRPKPFYYIKYGQYIDKMSHFYQKKIKKKEKRISKIKSLRTGSFVICQEHNLQESSEIANKLFDEDDKVKEEILKNLYNDLDLLKEKEKECENLKKEYCQSFKETLYGKFNPARQ